MDAVAGAHNVHIDGVDGVAGGVGGPAGVARQEYSLLPPRLRCLTLHTASLQMGAVGEGRFVGADADGEYEMGYVEVVLLGAADHMRQEGSHRGIHVIRDGRDGNLPLVVPPRAPVVVVPPLHGVADADSVQPSVAAKQPVNPAQLRVFWPDCQLRRRQEECPVNCQLP